MPNDRKEYLRQYHKDYYKIPENREKRLQKERVASLKNRDLYREWKTTLTCSVCSEGESCCMEMHHKDPLGKEFSVSKVSNKSFKRAIKESEKCVCLCSNCHKKVHAGILNVDEIPLYSYKVSTQQ